MSTQNLCPTCGAGLTDSANCKELYANVSAYTMNHPNPVFFIHQYVVDAYAAQHASQNQQPTSILFALVGLYLFTEKNYSGRQVQKAHMQLAKNKLSVPRFSFPQEKAIFSVAHVLKADPGEARDLMIKEWARSVWQTWKPEQTAIEDFLRGQKILSER